METKEVPVNPPKKFRRRPEFKIELVHELKDYVYITLGLICYSVGLTFFLMPYEITTGGVAGVGLIIYYATNFPVQYSIIIINGVLLILAFRMLGFRFLMKTIYAVIMLAVFIAASGWLVKTYITAELYSSKGFPLVLGAGQGFMACVVGSALCGIGLGMVLNYNGSTGGTDIIAAVVNKFRDVSLGRMVMACDLIIISTSYFIFHSWSKLIFGYVTLFIVGMVLDWVVNSSRQSVQFFIFSKRYADIADTIISQTKRGVTVLDGMGWYSKTDQKVLVVLAKRRQSLDIFRLVKMIDPNAFISQSSVIGVYGEGFDKLKVR